MDDGPWQFIDEAALAGSQKERTIIPLSYKTVRLNQDALAGLLNQAPMESADSVVSSQLVMTLPMPDGTLAKFHIEESPVMEPELAAQSPQIKTYRGKGIDDPTATTRFSWTPVGFHAVVLSASGSVWITPYAKDDTSNYITYSLQDLPREVTAFDCLFSDETANLSNSPNRFDPNFVSGSTLRTYRLALALTGDYTQAYGGGTVEGGRTAANIAVNIFNAIFEREVAIRLILINNENSIIYTNPATDPYTHGNREAMVIENQTNLDMAIGSANYDIGHVFDGSTGGGGGWQGWAYFGVCVSGEKAKASIIFTNQQPGNPATAHGMAHEMGHQFGASHTFNGTTGSCGNANQRVATSAYEPGSGSTIMAYGGICGNESLPTQDTYYHTASLQQIINWSTTGSGGGACPVQIATGNTPPTADAGADHTIPRNTPFMLTATGTDVNGDALTFCWEELDLGTASPPNTDDGTRPIFRSYPPTTGPSRTFPSLQYILNNANVPPTNFACNVSGGSCLTGEVLPSTTRTMNFQVTVRDNRVGGGGVRTDLMLLNVRADSGPFLVTQPNTGVNWTGGSIQTVMWSVNNTNLPPVSCANVKISLSTDGGNTFPIVLAANTTNDGSETIVTPNVSTTTTTARIKVEAVGNIFFDISNANFTIMPGSGSHTTTVGLYFPSNAGFYLRNSNTTGGADITFSYGPAGLGWIPLAGDWDGNGTDTAGLYNPANGTFYLRNSNSIGFADITFSYGPPGQNWIPVTGDWNGDGLDTVGLYNPANGVFYLRNTNSVGVADITFSYGPVGQGWIPIAGDWNGDGVDTIGLYNPSNSAFYLRNSNTVGNADLIATFGPAGSGWTPIVGDWNGDVVDTIGLYNPSNGAFYLRNSNTFGGADVVLTYGPANAGWKPIVGDWDGL